MASLPPSGLAARSTRLILLFSLPLVALILGLAGEQFWHQRSALLADLAKQTDEQRHVISSLLDDADRHLGRMRLAMERRLSGELPAEPSPLRNFLTTEAAERAGARIETLGLSPLGGGAGRVPGRLIAPPDLVSRGDQIGVFDAALDLLELMRVEHALGRTFQWSYFFSARGDFVTMYPAVSFGDVLSAVPAEKTIAGADDVVRDWLTYDVYTLGLPAFNPERKAYWTGVYDDAGGTGRMVSHAAPVYAGDSFVGVVGTDVVVGVFAELLGRLRLPAGTLAIVDPRGEVVAAVGAAGAKLPQQVAPVSQDATDDDGFIRADAAWVFSRALGASPFRLHYAVSDGELNGLLLPRFAPYALILAGLVATFGVLLAIMRRAFIDPSIALADYIRERSAGVEAPQPRLPAAWQPWLVAVSQTFEANREQQRRLEESEARLAAFLEHAPVAMLTKGRDGRFTMVNPEAARRLKRPREDIIGRATVEVIRREEAEVMDRAIAKVLATGKVQISEEFHPSLAPYLHSLFIRFPLKSSGGEVEGAGVFVVDLTPQKHAEAELARQREALHQSEKLAALGSLLAGVAHELNNPLSIVVGYAGMLHEMAPDEATKRRAREVHVAAERCARIVKTFLAMARSKPSERARVDIETVIDGVLELAAYGLRTAGIAVVRHRGAASPAYADADQLHQVFMNLVINAQQAMLTVDQPRRLEISTCEIDGLLRVEVADSGTGMSEDVRQRAFEPFFTTKPQGVGTGIGLSVCLGIVEAHGGMISVDSALGRGTRFTVELPAAAELQGPEAVRPGPAPRLAGRLLVVDDEPSIAEFVASVIGREGVEVEVATSGRAALAKLASHPFDAVLTDLRMPDLDGEKLIAAIEAEHAALAGRIVVMTGDALGARPALSRKVLTILEKPLDVEALRRALAPLLGSRRPAATAAAEAEGGPLDRHDA